MLGLRGGERRPLGNGAYRLLAARGLALEDGGVEVQQPIGDPFEVVDALDVGPRAGAELGASLGAERDQLGEAVMEVLRRRVDDRHRESRTPPRSVAPPRRGGT